MPLLSDLYGHQAWADAEHWRALERCPGALADRAIFERLHHIHLVQHAFEWITGDRSQPFELTKPADFADPKALAAWARAYHTRAIGFVAGMPAARLRAVVAVPWFKDPPLEISVERALVHATLHSHYHRGQNATRLRELGGEPPLTDLVVWYWRGRPPAEWP